MVQKCKENVSFVRGSVGGDGDQIGVNILKIKITKGGEIDFFFTPSLSF